MQGEGGGGEGGGYGEGWGGGGGEAWLCFGLTPLSLAFRTFSMTCSPVSSLGGPWPLLCKLGRAYR